MKNAYNDVIGNYIHGADEKKNFSLLVWVGFSPLSHVVLSCLTAMNFIRGKLLSEQSM